MASSIWSKIFRGALLAWVVCTLIVVWRRTYPLLHHVYFWSWAPYSLIANIPFVGTYLTNAPVPFNRQWYELGSLSAWLSGPAGYHQSFPAWCVQSCWGWPLLPPIAIIGVALFAQRSAKELQHIRGVQMISASALNYRIHGWRSYWQRVRPYVTPKAPVSTGLRIGDVTLEPNIETEHMLIAGKSGMGKSTILRHLLRQIRQRGEIAVIFDPDCEFVQEFYKPSDIILNPFDQRYDLRWTPWFEFRPTMFEVDVQAMAASLVRPNPRGAASDSGEFFRLSARTLIEGIFAVARDIPALHSFLAMPRIEMQKQFRANRGVLTDAAYNLIDPQAHDQGSGIVATASNALKPFYHLPTQGARTWSAREWAAKPEGWIFLTSSEDTKDALFPLQAIWIDTLIRWLMFQETYTQRVHVMLDELPSLGHQSNVEKAIARGRKRGIAVYLGFQDVAQLNRIYGRDEASVLTNGAATKVILQCGGAETAEWASKVLNSQEADRFDTTMVTGVSDYREGLNLAPHRLSRHLVTPAELLLLERFHGYLCCAGRDRAPIKIEEAHMIQNIAGFLPR
jgi:energy-coupling factor transporter ATP-binding protein EcfA2